IRGIGSILDCPSFERFELMQRLRCEHGRGHHFSGQRIGLRSAVAEANCYRRGFALSSGGVPIASVAIEREYVLLSDQYDPLIISQSGDARQIVLDHIYQRLEVCADVKLE